MSPEVWRGENAISQSNIYSLGAMLHELSCGRLPHQQETMEALVFAVTQTDVLPLAAVAPGVDPRLCSIIERCLHRDPGLPLASGWRCNRR